MSEMQELTLKTSNIGDELKAYADKYEIDVSSCDFTLNGVRYYVRDSARTDFQSITKEQMQTYLDKDKIINEHIEFHQVYTITIKKREPSSLLLKYIVKFDDQSSHPVILLGSSSKIPYKTVPQNEMLKLLYKELNKIKVLHNIIINIFDDTMKVKLRAFIKYLYAGKFTQKIKLPLFDGIKPEVTKNSKLIYWYKEKISDSQIIEVEADELLIEFIKPIFGKNGFNAFGEIISADSSSNRSDLEIEIDDESIKTTENKESKSYRSLTKGFVHIKNDKLFIDNSIRVEKLSRNNTAVASEEKNNIEVQIAQYDTDEDSIGEGVELVSESIHVTGHVGANSLLEASSLKIDGATHQDSSQLSKDAFINRHKGTLRCHKAKINLLEGGQVNATYVEIDTCLGGSIYAEDVVIGHVKSNLKIYASNSITIGRVSGEDNLFKMSYKDIPILESKLKYIKSDIGDLKYELSEAKRHHEKRVPAIQEEIKDLQKSQDAIVYSYKNATINVENAFTGLNNIVFTIDANHEIVFKTQEQSYETFKLKIDEEGESITLEPVGLSISLT